jgi:hypothetical protein
MTTDEVVVDVSQDCLSFPVGLLHPLPCAGLARRSLSRLCLCPGFPRIDSLGGDKGTLGG